MPPSTVEEAGDMSPPEADCIAPFSFFVDAITDGALQLQLRLTMQSELLHSNVLNII
jgi:hypothetical protein